MYKKGPLYQMQRPFSRLHTGLFSQQLFFQKKRPVTL